MSRSPDLHQRGAAQALSTRKTAAGDRSTDPVGCFRKRSCSSLEQAGGHLAVRSRIRLSRPAGGSRAAASPGRLDLVLARWPNPAASGTGRLRSRTILRRRTTGGSPSMQVIREESWLRVTLRADPARPRGCATCANPACLRHAPRPLCPVAGQHGHYEQVLSGPRPDTSQWAIDVPDRDPHQHPKSVRSDFSI